MAARTKAARQTSSVQDGEYFEVWYTEADSAQRRHQNAQDLSGATEIANDVTAAGAGDVEVTKVTTSTAAVKVTITPKPEAEAES